MTELLHPPPQMTPKRKRTDPPPLSPARSRIASSPRADSAFTFQLPTRSIQRPSPFPDLRETGEPADSPDAAESPASSGVVRQFRGLAVLDSGSGRAGGGQNDDGNEDDGQDDDGEDSEGGGRSGANCKINDESKGVAPLLEQGDEGLVARKRLKRDDDNGDDGGSDSPAPTTMMNIDQVTSSQQQHPYLAPRAATAVWPLPTALPNAEPSLPSSASTLLSEPAQVTESDPPPIQDLQGGEDAAAATTGAATSTPTMIPQGEDDEDSEIVEPIRAALTWREEEITVYDPEDKDDDGAGMDGVGFQPPPAIARAIALKKRQQLLAYKKMALRFRILG
ncbi:unnamed protein product [Parascedosporium putredinis]|uniref:Uncharacterized protein n=1 Tax=Parascedosporium putredinis TaxID=1442378 RepID=A0A9P1H323_9PEZI|nr:unnamed protein product [Parascedosporium putredinis]CAI7994788.1 unnamed protein product [Parascedosporium putredinis]